MSISIERLPYTGALPASFFAIADHVYDNAAFRPAEVPAVVEQLFALEAARHDIVLYTDHRHLRLAGLFPHGASEALFGFWETTPDAALNAAAFAALAAEASRRGYRTLVGPIDFNTYQRYRLRLGEAPSWGAFDREPLNPGYYPELLTAQGFRARLTFESRLVTHTAIPAVYVSKQALLETVATLPYEFIPITPTTWRHHENDLIAFIHQTFGANPAYQPISQAQFRLLYPPDYAARLCPYSSVLVRDPQRGRLAALSLCHPNYAPLHLLPGIIPDFKRDFPRLAAPTLLAKTVGVHPDYRGQGLMSYLGAYAMRHFRDYYHDVIFCLMRTGNRSLHFTDSLPFEPAHYALYEHLLA